MARLRDDYAEFTRRSAEVLAIGPDSLASFQNYWRDQRLPFIGLPDPGHEVARRYQQQVKIFKWGRMPLVTAVDSQGMIRYAHYGSSMSDIPENGVLLQALDEMRARTD